MKDQKTAFQERLKRIDSGKQFEHADVVGYRTQTRFNSRAARRPKHKRTFLDTLMIPFAFLCGVSAVFAGRFLYFHMSQMTVMPEAFVDLGGRGMILFAAVLAGILTVTFSLATGGRLMALALGCMLMHFGEGAIASNAQDVWARLFSPAYAADMAERGADFRLVPAG